MIDPDGISANFDMNKILYRILLALFFIGFIFFVKKDRQKYMNQLEQNLKIQKSDDLKFIVDYKQNNRGVIEITSTRGSFYQLLARPNTMYSEVERSFYDYLEKGDSIFRAANSDTIYVFREGERKFWITPR